MEDSTTTTGLPTDDTRALADRIVGGSVFIGTDANDILIELSSSEAMAIVLALRRTASVTGRDREKIIDAHGRIVAMPDRQYVAQAVLAVLRNPKGLETIDWEIADVFLALSQHTETPAAIVEMREALDKMCDIMAFILNHCDVGSWYEQFSQDLMEARAALSLPAGRVDRDQRTSEGGWRSIETAPRDGTRLLGTGGGLEDTVEVIAYNERAGAWNTENLTLDDRDDDAEGYNRPTHWQLLPASPSQSTAQGGEG